ncbi:C-type lectin domain-containing protein 87 [Caenorhabditis elegans]|uniref:C-type lectin domain-containing protein 87 n=1 Tax=Caenorhabditis elegans TaxID=6239 RepID=CLC87_CAEEL|nr:C-type lectin domain-containing protein 87 [Caenorhabditis elegans]Q9XVS3.1 RecName: Full=C-type lectin domain-containing protein 87; AltName: Full=Chondroitin proteoglycan 5; Flags: Precursor [Caenorhabditis elegans]ABC65815.1 chondroitin proteoglycan-5 [Caenorhabditis elegans]CAB02756.1 C-type lectin domain-containing protein 87 [Caenorhabditis elegans]|eukprot:NP_492682.1 C-type lectin domain-containing protein 87 [Caenorhabditis elegans]
MRFCLLVAFILPGLFLVHAAPTSSTELPEASGEAPETSPLVQNDEQPHQRLTFYNWDYKDLGTTAFEDISFPARQPPAFVNQTEKCPDGWLRFADSCYWIEKELLGFAKAERNCFEKQSTLFVANSIEEWDAIRVQAKEAFFSWIGLVRFTHYEKLEQLPRWQTEGALNPTKINWLIKPYKPLFNGWSSLANCAASYKSPSSLESASYTYFYPCTYMLYSICERNSTIVNALQ